MNPASGNARGLSLPPGNITEFLERVFGPDWEFALVCVKDMVRAGDGWPVGYARDMVKYAGEQTNNYFSLSLFSGKRRLTAEWVALFALLIDDVGTKLEEAEVEAVLGKPSWIVRTSVSVLGKTNQQWGYRLECPVVDQGRAWSLSARVQLALPAADNMDPTHLVRLPWSRHRKQANEQRKPGGWPVQLVRWSERTVSEQWVHEQLDERGIGEARVPSHFGGGGGSASSASVDEDEDPLFQALDQLGLVLGERRGATGLGPGRTWDVRCPWAHEHSERVNEGAAYGVGGGFRCMHGHCAGRTMDDFKARLDEMLREQSGGTSGLASMFFDEAPEAPEGSDGETTLAGETGVGDSSEDGLAHEFVNRHGVGLRYDHTVGHWRIWRRDHWFEDRTLNIKAWIRKMVRTEHYESRTLRKHASISAIERLAQSDQRVAVTNEAWNPDLLRIGAPGVEVDLRSGLVEQPEPTRMITRRVLVTPSASPTPVWDRFLAEAMGGDQDMVAFIHTWFGYCLSGNTSWEKFAFLYGTGGNGKTTVTSVMSAIFGAYAMQTPAETFMERRNPAHYTEIARLAGARLLIANEVPDNATFNLGRLKEHSDHGGVLVGNFMRQDLFEFRLTHKITLVGNHKPRLRHVDAAIKRRLLLIPFLFRPVKVDPTLKTRLVAEYPCILHKLIDAGAEVHRTLSAAAMPKVPKRVLAATEDYFTEQDELEQWITECCDVVVGARIGVAEAFNAYTTWCYDQGAEVRYTLKTFSGAVLERQPQCSVVHTENGSTIKGLELKF